VSAAPRPTPFDLVFGALAAGRFPALREALAAAGGDPRDRDAFLLVREAVELLHDLRPDEGLGPAVETLAALVHHAYLFWMDGARVGVVSEEGLETIMAEGPVEGRKDGRSEGETSENLPSFRPSVRPSVYIQLPPLVVWGSPVTGAPPEPLDGWFLGPEPDRITVLAVFGLHPARPGLTAAEVAGPRPTGLRREDGSPLFAPLLAGGRAAGLHSLAGGEELLELAWRVEAALLPSSTIPSRGAAVASA
jgi:hypothetical protein